MEFNNIDFDLPKNQSNVIKVIGVGGGGSNAINHMFELGITGVDFVICNTDAQALQNSPVPTKIQLGLTLTEGLGAGAKPEIGQQAAIEAIPEIEKMLDTNTKMVFITAGMGGGTGTGAAPIIAKLAKERDILTVGIVTIPFAFEGRTRAEQAKIGVERLRKCCDSMIVINNNKLREVFGNLTYTSGFSKADDVLATAAKGIAEVITKHYTINIDLKDAKTVLADSGTAIMGSAKAAGENRAKIAITNALESPLLNDNKIRGAKNVLLLIVSGTDEITFDEIGDITDHIEAEAGLQANVITGMGTDLSLENAISVTIIATGFNPEQQNEIINTEPNKIIYTLDDSHKITKDLLGINKTHSPDLPLNTAPENHVNTHVNKMPDSSFQFSIEQPMVEERLIPTSEFIKNYEVVFEIVKPNKPEININAIHVNEPEFVKPENQFTLAFEMPLSNQNKPKIEEEVSYKNIFEEPKQQIFTEVQQTNLNPEKPEIIRHTLDDYLEMEKQLINSKPETKNKEEDGSDLKISIAAEPPVSYGKTEKPITIDPTEMTIEQAEELKRSEKALKFKNYNYKFNLNSDAEISRLEQTPAYKRNGIELSEPSNEPNISRNTIGFDSNNGITIRKNNPFFGDVVD